MLTKEELIKKYPANISATYFKYGIIFDWDEEYYDIVWDHNITGVVILELFKHGIIINGIDVMIKDELLFNSAMKNFMHEGR